MSNLWQRIFTGIVFLVVLIGSIVWSSYSFVLLFGAVSMLCLWEYLVMIRKSASPDALSMFVSGIAIYATIALVALAIIPATSLLFLFLIPVVLVISEMFKLHEDHFIHIGVAAAGLLYVVVPFGCLVLIGFWGGNYNWKIVLSYFLIIWMNDIFAYVTGRLIGKHKIAPHISIGKTIEGTLGGIVFGIGTAVAIKFIDTGNPFTYAEWAGFALITCSTAIISDLSESRIKRMANMKDSSNLLPGHGGFLDRFDSVLLSAPSVFVYLHLISIL